MKPQARVDYWRHVSDALKCIAFGLVTLAAMYGGVMLIAVWFGGQ